MHSNFEYFSEMIRFASVSASQIGSKSTSTGVESKQEEMGKQLQEFVKEELPSVNDTKNSSNIQTDDW